MKKNISLTIILLLIFNLFYPILSIASDEDNIIFITTVEEIVQISNNVNSGEDSYEGKTIRLVNDIDLGCTEENQWIPIGKNEDYCFKGVFDGCGFSIKGMYLSSNDNSNNGLFGYVEDATISNLIIEGRIEGTMSADPCVIGSIAARSSNSLIKNCISNVIISCVGESDSTWGLKIGGIVGQSNSRSTISNCINNGDINCETTGSSGSVGGINGYNWSSTIEKSVNNGKIETKGAYHTGGITGEMYYANAKIEKCYNNGNIKINSIPQGAGGIAGQANVGEFASCFNTGSIEYTGNGTTNGTGSIYKIGGITGETYNNVIIKNCYNIGDTDTGAGIVGVISSDERQVIENNYYLEEKSDYGYYSSGIEQVEITEKTSAEMKNENFVVQLNGTTDDYTFDRHEYNDGYPILVWETDIEIVQKPTKLSYKQNIEDLDLSGGKIKILHNYNNYNTIIDMSNESISVDGFDNSEEKELTLTVIYKDEFKKYFDVSIVEAIPPILNIEYSTTRATNQDVTAIIKSNEKIQEVESWTLSDDELSLTKVYTTNTTETVEVFDIAGNSATIVVDIKNIDKNAPELNVSYAPQELTNQDVTATITANEKVQEVEGWFLSDDKLKLTKTYTVNAQEDVDVYDIAGNKTHIAINVQNIDKSDIELETAYSTTQMTNQNVEVVVSVNKEVQEVEGWTLSEDKTKLTKTYFENAEEELTIYDKAGNTKTTIIQVKNIDKISPEINVIYSTKQITNQNVEVKIVANEKLKEVEGWTLSEDETTLTRIYRLNGEEEITLYDLAGNGVNTQVKVDNIDKLSPELEIIHNNNTTNSNVTVIIQANEKIKEVDGWTLSEDKTTLTRVYSQNIKEVIKVYDLAGNATSKTIEINDIIEIDDTIVQTEIPKAGANVLITIVITSVLLAIIILGIKIKSFKDI